MSNRDRNDIDNGSLQSGEGDLAIGQDEREFGAGGQEVQQVLGGNDAPDRDVHRDSTLPNTADPSGRMQEQDQ